VPFERAQRLRESMPDAAALAVSIADLATARFEAGKLDEAVQLCRRALDLRHEAPGAG
jgi:hypothetical protein